MCRYATVNDLRRVVAEIADPAAATKPELPGMPAMRASLADRIAAASAVDIAAFLSADMVRAFRNIVAIRPAAATGPTDLPRVESLEATLDGTVSMATLPVFLALTVYRSPHETVRRIDFTGFTPNAAAAVAAILAARPLVARAPGDSDRFVAYAETLLDRLLQDLLAASPGSERRARAAMTDFSTIQALFSESGLRRLMTLRARLMEALLDRDGIDRAPMGKPPVNRDSGRLRLAIVVQRVGAGPEGFFNLAHYEHLDRSRIEVQLFATAPRLDDPFATRMIAAADGYTELSGPVSTMVATVRAAGPDVALIAGNVIASTNRAAVLAWLAACRLAPIQGVNMCTPATTGFAATDFYLTGDSLQPDGARADFTEALVRLPGGAKQFALPDAHEDPPLLTRADLGLPADAVVLMSGANFCKIVPELSTAWIEILSRAENTVLALFPFNPNWSPLYMARPFMVRLHQEMAAAGVDADRLTLLRPLDSSAAVRGYLILADLYLDSHPYAGAVSLLDPLLCGVPPLAWRGRIGRSRQGASMLSALGLDDLVMDSRADYITQATALATDPAARADAASRVRQAMRRRPGIVPKVLDGADLAAKLTDALDTLVRDRAGETN